MLILLCGCVAPEQLSLGAELREDFWSRAPSVGSVPEPYPAWLEAHLEKKGLIGAFRPEIRVLPDGEGLLYLFRSPDKPNRESKGTVLFIHGYFNHATGYHKIIRYLVKSGWNVAAPDLPGHGLDSGSRGEVDGFRAYGRLVAASAAVAGEFAPEDELVLLSHSLGGAAIIEYLLQDAESKASLPVDAILLVNPLIRNRNYGLIQAARILADPMVDYFPVSLSNPYGVNAVPLRWLRDLSRWNRRLRRAEPLDTRLMVLQSEGDATLDWGYNLELIEKKFPRAEILRIPGEDHDLFWPENQERIFPLIEGLFSAAIGFKGL